MMLLGLVRSSRTLRLRGLPLERVAGYLDDRYPPGFAHVGQVGAVCHRHAQAVAGVVRGRNGTVHRAAQERLDQLFVPFEPAGAQHHARAAADANIVAVLLDSYANDGTRFGDQFDRPGIGVESHAEVQQALQQACDQRGARHAVVAGRTVDRGVDAGPGFGVDTDVAEVGGKRRDPVPPFAEPIQVERFRVQRPSARRPTTRQFGLVIREPLGDFELQLAVLLDEVEHLRAGVHERLDQFTVHHAQRLRLEVAQCVGLGQLAFWRAPVGGYPDDAA